MTDRREPILCRRREQRQQGFEGGIDYRKFQVAEMKARAGWPTK